MTASFDIVRLMHSLCVYTKLSPQLGSLHTWSALLLDEPTRPDSEQGLV